MEARRSAREPDARDGDDEAASAELAHALFDQSPFSSVIYRPDGSVAALNSAFTSLMGLSKADVPDGYSVLTDPQLEAQGVLPLVRRAFEGEAVTFPPLRYDGTVYGEGGKVTWTQAQMYPVRDASGVVRNVVLVHVDLTDRMEAELALSRSRSALAEAQTRLAAVLDAVSDGITVQDDEGRLVYSNNSAARLVGFGTAEEFLATPMAEVLERFELLAPDGTPMAREDLPSRRAARGEKEPEQLLRYRIRATGEERWSLVRARAIAPADGRPALFVNYFQDVTERLRHERELESTSERLARLAEEQKATLAELIVRSRESEEARQAAERAEEQWRFLAEASRLLANRLDVEATLRSVTQLAVPRIADWCALHLLDEEGRVRQLEVAHADPRRLDEARELQQRYPPDPRTGAVHDVVETGRSQLLATITDEMLVVAAHDEEHLRRLRDLGLRSAMVVPLATDDRVLGAFTLISAESGRVYDGRDLAFAESLATRAASAIHAAELYLAAQQANRAKTDFLAVISHELRTPLNAITGYAELLAGGVSGELNAVQREQLDRITGSARHLTDLIETVLTFARVEAGRTEIHPGTLDLTAVAHEATAFVAPAAARKGLELRVEGEAEVEIVSDVARVRQILLNLLSNAVKFTTTGGVQVLVGREGDEAFVRVSDSGVGIAPADLARVWEPFTQLDSALTRRTGGTGLGLPVSRGLAELLGGSLAADSTPGVGSTFTLRLPLAR